MHTAAPAFASAFAVTNPMPLVAPVRKTVMPSKNARMCLPSRIPPREDLSPWSSRRLQDSLSRDVQGRSAAHQLPRGAFVRDQHVDVLLEKSSADGVHLRRTSGH